MATLAHCAFCFETLVAHFDRRQPLRLAQVEELWEQYQELLLGGADSNGCKEDGDDDSDDHDASSNAGAIEPRPITQSIVSPTGRPAAISRLLGQRQDASSSSSSVPSTSSTSTSASTPSRNSNSNTPTSSSASSRSSLVSSSAYPLFVTWNVLSRSGRKSLRGCIGTFEAQELEDGLESYALTSALEDVRFSPISSSLLPSLSAHVTLLTNFSAPKQDPMDWTLGTHGLRISFTHRGRQYGSTYLPDVAREQGWTKDETLTSLMRKAGWSGSSRDWQRAWHEGRGKLVTYEGLQVGITYTEWKEWRDWVNNLGIRTKAQR